MITIPLSMGHVALIDDSDYALVSPFKWHAHISYRRDGTVGNIYAVRNDRVSGYRTTIQLHRFILGLIDDGRFVDHRDHNGLNCQKCNLRVASRRDNGGNRKANRGKTGSQFKGVYRYIPTEKWMACIRTGEGLRRLGRFYSEEDAARAYDAAASEYFGEFALLNYPAPKLPKAEAR